MNHDIEIPKGDLVLSGGVPSLIFISTTTGRNIAPDLAVETTSPRLEISFLSKFSFSSGDINVWSGLGNISFGGDTYTGLGDLGKISDVSESTLLKSASLNFTLSGIPSSIIALALDDDYQEREAKLWIAAMSDPNTFVIDPYLLFTGRMDVMEIDEGAETSSIMLSAENRLVDLERPKVRRYTPEDQKEVFATDEGLDFVPSLSDGKQLVWG